MTGTCFRARITKQLQGGATSTAAQCEAVFTRKLDLALSAYPSSQAVIPVFIPVSSRCHPTNCAQTKQRLDQPSGTSVFFHYFGDDFDGQCEEGAKIHSSYRMTPG